MFSTTRSFSTQETKTVSKLTAVAIAAITYFVVIIVILHFLRPDLDPIRQPTSEYAVGPYGFLMTSAFFSMSLASWALIVGLYQGISQPVRSQVGLGLLGMWGVGVLIAMLFPIDPEGSPQTVAGTIHRINGPLIFLCVTVGTILLSRRFKQDENWRLIYHPALLLSLVMLAAFILTFLSFAAQLGFTGLMQRIHLTALVPWMLLTTTRLRSIALQPN
jgi:hypothetical protein